MSETYEVWEEHTNRTEAKLIKAFDPADAAEFWAEETDQYNDYAMLGGKSARVFVASSDNEPQLYVIDAEAIPEYNARLVVTDTINKE
jgi:hypothetical protein